jgi:regulator of sigma E protease
MLVALSGPAACFLGFMLLTFTVGLILGAPGPNQVFIGRVVPGSAAAQAGLAAEDRILAISGHTVTDPAEVTSQVQASAGLPFALELERAGTRQTLQAQARLVESRYLMGIELRMHTPYERGAIGLSLQYAVQFPFHMAAALKSILAEAIFGQSKSAELRAPIYVVRILGMDQRPGQVILTALGPWLLVVSAVGFVLSILLLLVAQPRRVK